jgi:serine/threonine-protein kinase
VAGVLYQAAEARAQARLASREAQKATSIKDYLLAIFEANRDSHPDGAAARLTTAEELMSIATNKVLEETGADAEVRLEMLTILHNIQGQFDNFPLQLRLGAARIALVEKEFGAGDVRLADALNDHAELLRARQHFDEARAAANRGVALREAQGDRGSWTRGALELTLGQIAYGDFAGEST